METELNIIVGDAPGDPSVKLVYLSGELDISNISKFQQVIEPYVAMESNRHFIFNLKNLGFIGSKGIGYFIYLFTTLNHSGRRVAMAEVNPDIMDILSLVGIQEIIPIYATLGEALKTSVV